MTTRRGGFHARPKATRSRPRATTRVAPTRFLGIETTSDWLGLCLWEGEKLGDVRVKARFFRRAQGKHSDWIVPKIDQLLKQAHWSPSSLSGIAVDMGPGSFTGVRIGLTVARMMGQSLGVPLIPIPSLDLMAAAVKDLPPVGTLACVRRAIPEEIYLGFYQIRSPGLQGVRLRRLGPLMWLSEKEVAGRLQSLKGLKEPLVWVGRGWSLNSTFEGHRVLQTPEALANLATQVWSLGGKQPYQKVVPLYLQPSWAERKNKH